MSVREWEGWFCRLGRRDDRRPGRVWDVASAVGLQGELSEWRDRVG